MKKFLFAAAAASLFAIPGAASAQYYPGYGGYNNGYQRGYNNTYQRGYNPGYSGQGYYGQNYGGNRCSGTTGTIIGGVAGAVVGSKIAGGRQRYDYYGNRRGGSNATGAIIGGAVGALLGRKVDKDSCNRRNYTYGYRY